MLEAKIEICNLSKTFHERKVLDNLNLKIFKGETLVILGPSSCGKSVLLKHIIGLMKPDNGSIFIEGKEITHLKEKKLNEIRKKIGMLFQSSALFDSLTVGENISFILEEYTKLSFKEIDKIVEEKLAMVGLIDCKNLKPVELSGGMKKRVGLARAIVYNPAIILYDEPTTGLDPIIASTINNLIIKIKKDLQVTSVIVTHDVSSAYIVADRIAMLFDGKIIEIGTSREIKKSTNSLIEQFFKKE